MDFSLVLDIGLSWHVKTQGLRNDMQVYLLIFISVWIVSRFDFFRKMFMQWTRAIMNAPFHFFFFFCRCKCLICLGAAATPQLSSIGRVSIVITPCLYIDHAVNLYSTFALIPCSSSLWPRPDRTGIPCQNYQKQLPFKSFKNIIYFFKGTFQGTKWIVKRSLLCF